MLDFTIMSIHLFQMDFGKQDGESGLLPKYILFFFSIIHNLLVVFFFLTINIVGNKANQRIILLLPPCQGVIFVVFFSIYKVITHLLITCQIRKGKKKQQERGVGKRKWKRYQERESNATASQCQYSLWNMWTTAIQGFYSPTPTHTYILISLGTAAIVHFCSLSREIFNFQFCNTNLKQCKPMTGLIYIIVIEYSSPLYPSFHNELQALRSWVLNCICTTTWWGGLCWEMAAGPRWSPKVAEQGLGWVCPILIQPCNHIWALCAFFIWVFPKHLPFLWFWINVVLSVLPFHGNIRASLVLIKHFCFIWNGV